MDIFLQQVVSGLATGGIYASLALALARDAGYVHLNLPGAPEAVHYPPLYPLFLTPFFVALPLAGAATAAKIANLVMAAAAAGLVAWHAERARILGDTAPRGLAAAVTALAATAIPLITVQAVLFSEPLFMLLLAVAVALADRSDHSPKRPRITGGVAALALLARSIGLALAVGVALYALVVRRDAWRRALPILAPVVLAGLAWSVWVLAHRDGIDPALALGYGTYASHVDQAGWAALGANLMGLPRPLGALTLGWLPHPVLYVGLGLPALAVLLYGVAVLARRSAQAMRGDLGF